MAGAPKPTYEFGPFRLDAAEHLLLRDGRPVPLTPKVFDLLRVLVQNAGHLVEKETLLREVWPDSFVDDGALNRSVSVLRKTLGDGSSGSPYIETVPKRGYRFVAPVTTCVEGGPPVAVEAAEGARVSVEALRRRTLTRWAGLAGAVLGVAALGAGIRGPVESGEPAAGTLTPLHTQVTFTGKEGAPALSPDGRRIAYVSDEMPERKVMVQELAGGQPLTIFTAPELGHLRWSPDGAALLIWARGAGRNGVYILPQLGGTPRRIAAGQYTACWSPDGSTIAVGTYLGGKIRFFNRSGQEQQTVPLQGTHWSIWDIDWSAASGQLMFVSNDYQGRFTIWTIRPDGRDQRRLLASDTEIPAARWAPAGNAIYYFGRQNQTVSLYKLLVDADPRNRQASPRTLITGLEADRSFALSADAKRLVYARAPYHSNLWMLDAEAGGAHGKPVTRALTQGTALIERPRVSPDGTAIVVNIGPEPTANLYTVPIGGGIPRQLTFLNSFSVGGAWSPDGTRIAFASTQGGKPRVWSVSAAGGTPTALSSSDVSDSFDVAWSPGAHVLYQQAGNRNYYDLDPDTRAEAHLVKDASVGWIFSPVHSPDGRNVAVFWNRGADRGIWIVDASSGRETLIFKTPESSAMPVGWSRDGSAIYALVGRSATYRGAILPLGGTLADARIVRVPLDGGEVQAVASLPFDEIGGVSMTPDGLRFVVTVYSSRSDVWIVDDFDVSVATTR